MTIENKSKATGLRFGHFWSMGFLAPKKTEDDRIEVTGKGMKEDVAALNAGIIIDDDSFLECEVLDCDILDQE